MDKTAPLIAANGVGKRVIGPDGEIRILDRIDLAVFPGESVAIVGASGSGKTTLLGLMAGLDLPTSGEITLAGESLSRLDEEARAAIRARDVGFVFQSFHLLPTLSAEENVALPLELNGRPDASRVREVMTSVGLAERMHHYPRTLSGGEQQRVALARAFVGRPRILFADEPTGNLDQVTGRQISDLLFSMNREYGTTLVLVTHDLALAERCQRVLRLDAGQLAREAPA